MSPHGDYNKKASEGGFHYAHTWLPLVDELRTTEIGDWVAVET
jgi:hypothetical protein